MNIINKIILFMTAMITGFAVAFKLGSNHENNKENQEVANEIQDANNIKKGVSRLSDTDLDAELQKWKKVAGK